jgi:murein DD-endopeptidase MepM/ murein hydrolase activator NlpD
MAKPEDARPEQHRPLPSVHMALLPHELKAARARQVTLLIAVALLVATGIGYVAAPWLASVIDIANAPPPADDDWPSERVSTAPEPIVLPTALPEPPASDETASATATETSTDAATGETAAVLAVATPEAHGAHDPGAALSRVVKPFGRARGFRDALLRAGTSAADADSLTRAFEKLVDYRRCTPEHDLVLYRDADNALVAFEYHAGIVEKYRADRGPDGAFLGRKIEVLIETRRAAKGGHVSDSLGRAVEALGLSGMASAFVEAFEGTVDFKKDTREGDSFRIIVDEQLVEGQPIASAEALALEYTGARHGRVVAFWFEPKDAPGDFYDETGRALHGGWLRTPLRYDHVSSGFNPRRRHPILKRIVPHNGVDYAAAPGTTVWSAADGKVTFAGARGANGNLVSIKHAGGYETHYAHLLRIARGIKAGVAVRQRQPIGAVGSTGRSTGPHLHFALKRNGRFIDPNKQLNGPGKALPAAQLATFKERVAQLKRELAAIVLAAAPAPAGEEPQAETFHEDSLDL